MGLGVAIGGAIGALTVFVMILTYPMISDSIFEFSDSKSQINHIENSISKSLLNFKNNIHIQSGISFVNFTVTNAGIEKFWDFENFHLTITYDGNVDGTKTTLTETFDYAPIGFAGTTVEGSDRGEFKIQRGTTIIAANAYNATLVEGVDFSRCSGDCFVKQVSNKFSGIGTTSGGGSQDMQDVTTFVSYDGGLSSAGDDINFTRHNNPAEDNRVSWEIWEYVGAASGVNEMKVLDTGYCTFGTSTNSLTCGGGIGFDAVTSADNNCGLSPCSFSHTAGSGNNRFLIVAVAPGGTATITSVTYGLKPLTEIRSDNNGSIGSSLWYLRESDIATRSGDTILVTMTADVDTTMGAITFVGVDQSFDPKDSDKGATGSSSTPSLSLTNNFTSAVIVDVVSTLDGPMTAGSNQKLRWNTGQGAAEGASSTTDAATTGPYTMNWTNTAGSRDWSMSTVVLKPSIGSPVVSGVTDDNDVAVIITGLANPDTGRTDVESCLVTSEWDGDNDVAVFKRDGVGNESGGADACDVSYAVVEWTGSNWSVQRIQHRFTDAEASQTQTESITSVGDISNAFFHTQQRNGPDNDHRKICASGTEVELISPEQIAYTITFDSGNGAWTSPDMTAVTWIISNSDLNEEEKIIVNHYTPSQHGSGGPEEDNWEVGITSLRDGTSEAAITGFSAQTERCDDNYPRSFLAARLNSSSTVEFWQSDSGRPNEISFQVTEFPHVEFTNVVACHRSNSLGVNEWMIGNVTSDGLDPNIWNPGETIQVCSKTAYPIYPTSNVTVVLTTEDGYTVRGFRAIP